MEDVIVTKDDVGSMLMRSNNCVTRRGALDGRAKIKGGRETVGCETRLICTPILFFPCCFCKDGLRSTHSQPWCLETCVDSILLGTQDFKVAIPPNQPSKDYR